VPFGSTSTAGVNASAPFGVWLTLIGADHVRPPSVDFDIAMSLWSPPLKRLSSHTT
jgi:hypothetical protein